MTDYLNTILFFVLLATAIALHVLRSMGKKQIIRREIQRMGGQIIKISENYWTHDKYAYTYKVIFTDGLGKEFRTNCKIYGTQIYWTRSPTELMNSASHPFNAYDSYRPGQKGMKPQMSRGLTAELVEERAISELKQQVIDKLSAENQQLRQELEQLRKSKNTNGK